MSLTIFSATFKKSCDSSQEIISGSKQGASLPERVQATAGSRRKSSESTFCRHAQSETLAIKELQK